MKRDLVEKLKSLDILEVANKLGLNITSYKKSVRCVSKSHIDRNPSMKLNPKTNGWKCFACSKGGDVIELVKEVYDLDFKDACDWLCNEYCIQNSYSRRNNIVFQNISRKIKKEQPNKEVKTKVNSDIYEWIIDNTFLTDHAKHFLFKERMLSHKVVESLNIKSIDNFPKLKEEAIKVWGKDELLKCGFDKGGLAWYRKPIIFPYYNKEGRVIQIQARASEWKEKNERFANLKGIETCMYNIPLLNKLNIGDEIYICEGVTDCLSVLSFGYNSVAIPGVAAYKDIYATYLRPYRVKLIPDTDSAANSLILKMEESFDKINKDFERIDIPSDYKDFSDYYIDFKNGKSN